MKTTITVIIVLVLAIGGFAAWEAGVFTKSNTDTTTNTNTDQNSVVTTPTTSSTAAAATIIYTNSGFSPASVSIKQGDTVTWINSSSGNMWVASAVHPAHAQYSGTTLSQHCPDTANTAFDECTSVPAGGTWSFTFQKIGTWNYHNHVAASAHGTVTVTQ